MNTQTQLKRNVTILRKELQDSYVNYEEQYPVVAERLLAINVDDARLRTHLKRVSNYLREYQLMNHQNRLPVMRKAEAPTVIKDAENAIKEAEGYLATLLQMKLELEAEEEELRTAQAGEDSEVGSTVDDTQWETEAESYKTTPTTAPKTEAGLDIHSLWTDSNEDNQLNERSANETQLSAVTLEILKALQGFGKSQQETSQINQMLLQQMQSMLREGERGRSSLRSSTTLPPVYFDGDVTKFESFMNTFDNLYGKRNIPTCEKFEALMLLLKGEPKDLMEGYLNTETNYWMVLDVLTEKYGKSDLVKETLANELLNLSDPTNPTNDADKFRIFERIMRQMQGLGEDINNKMYESMLERMISPELLEEMTKEKGKTKDWNLSKARKVVQLHHEAKQKREARQSAMTRALTQKHTWPSTETEENEPPVVQKFPIKPFPMRPRTGELDKRAGRRADSKIAGSRGRHGVGDSIKCERRRTAR